MNSRSAPEPKTIVLLIHGIRTRAWWQGEVKPLIEEAAGATVIPLKYGRFDLLRFWCPFGFCRNGPIAVLHRAMRDALSDYAGAGIVVIAHSYGTYAITRLLLENSDIRLRGLVLCGSIVRNDFPWSRIASQFTRQPMREAVVNDCGTRDVWPLFAKSTTWGYGNSGTYGFGSAQVTDRFHALDHGGYFNAGFVKKYWVPFVAKGVIAASNVERAGAHTPAWFQVLELPYKWLAMAAAMCAAAAYLLLPGAGIGPVAATDPIGAMLGRWNYEGITCAEGIDVAKVGDHLVFRTAGTPDYLHAIRKIDGGTVMTEVLSPEAEKGNLYALEPTGTKLSVRNLTAGQNDEWDRCP